MGRRHHARVAAALAVMLAGAAAIALAALLLAPAVAAPAPVGAVAGRVTFRGDPPAVPPLEIAKDREACGDSVASEVLVVSAQGRGVRDAVVSLEGVAEAAPEAPPETTLENKGCRFVPHVQALRAGGELAVVNSDPVLHNLRGWLDGPRSLFNIVQPTQGQVTRRTIKRGGAIRLTCDAHPHMNGWLLAFDHPYFGVTDENGHFRIGNVPPGSYRINVWHEGWKVMRREPEGRLVYEAPRVLSRDVIVPRGTVTIGFELSD